MNRPQDITINPPLPEYVHAVHEQPFRQVAFARGERTAPGEVNRAKAVLGRIGDVKVKEFNRRASSRSCAAREPCRYHPS